MWHYVETNQFGALTQSEMQDNVDEIYNILKNEWTLEAISGMLGNAQQESGMNPAQWQHEYPIGTTIGGFGLYQWTPSTHYTDYATANGYDWKDGTQQVIAMNKPIPSDQWSVKNSGYTFEEFKQLTDVDTATQAFYAGFERAGIPATEQRLQYGREWYTYLSGKPPTPSPTEVVSVLKNVFYGNKKIIYRGKINNFFRK